LVGLVTPVQSRVIALVFHEAKRQDYIY
jgi:hypothetical protein